MTVADLVGPPEVEAPAVEPLPPAVAPAMARGRSTDSPPRDVPWAELVTVHSLGWLATTSAVGLLLATLLLFPALGDLLAPLTYGRWAPLHLDLGLYGWLGLPLVGLLLHAYAPAGGGGRLPSLAVHAWSASLAAGAVSWLAGRSSGRLFLDWSGAARWGFLAALVVLWVVLGALLARRAAAARRGGGRLLSPGTAGRAGLLAALAAVPPLLFLAGRPGAYPPVNPATGGPTGASLLASSLAVVAVLLLAPRLLGLPRRAPRGGGWQAPALLAAHAAALALLGGGDHDHRELAQVLAVASLLPWAWWVPRELGRFRWPAAARRWRTALLAWGGLLLATSVAGFLPGVLDRQKFTHLLVAHAHLAMAAFATSFAALVLVALGPPRSAPGALAAPAPFALWHGGTALHLVALTALGGSEIADPGAMLRPSAAVVALFAVRWLAGAAMLAAALGWWAGALGRVER